MRCGIRWVVFFIVAMVVVGCSSNVQRFEDGFYSGPTYSKTIIPTLSQGGVIKSGELPPVEQSDDAIVNYSASDSLEEQKVTYSSDGRVMGTPPQNLGTLPLSQENSFPVARKNSYIVQNGDTPLSIAQQLGVSVEALKLANGINDDLLYVGQVLNIPNESKEIPSYTSDFAIVSSQSDDGRDVSKPVLSIPSKAMSTENPGMSRVEQDFSKQMITSESATDSSRTVTPSDDNVSLQSTGISNMRWPVVGRLLSNFGQKDGTIIKQGIDISVPEGSSVKAAENGIVIYASDGLKKLGNVVMIRHEGDIITIYGHNSRLVVSKGQRVRRGDEIAKSGISGDAETPRVYFEVRKNSEPVDPNEYLEK